ncbi:MAG: DNA adenine methylase, partial [Cellulomonadaceae bacterium]|nr:DNA adenine methylase [Cellulomonadaceae bacterium]
MHLPLIQSPLNYTGGKFRLLPQLLEHFPADLSVFVDLFCGAGNVGANIGAPHIILNDAQPQLVSLLRMFQHTNTVDFLTAIDALITCYGFSRTCDFGYGYYGCNSSQGVAAVNREPYLRLRGDFNGCRDGFLGVDSRDALTAGFAQPQEYLLFTLIVFAFNNQIRFNARGEYNLPVGKRDFNGHLQAKVT